MAPMMIVIEAMNNSANDATRSTLPFISISLNVTFAPDVLGEETQKGLCQLTVVFFLLSIKNSPRAASAASCFPSSLSTCMTGTVTLEFPVHSIGLSSAHAKKNTKFSQSRVCWKRNRVQKQET